MAKRAFGELELQILDILKGAPHLTVKDVHQKLGGRDNYNTIMTVMNRLTEKGQLGRERTGLQYAYWIVAGEKSPSLLEKLKQKLFGVKTAAMVSYLIDSADDLTAEDVAALEETLRKVKSRQAP